MKKYLKNFYKLISKQEMRVLPGNVAFFLVLSIFPVVTLAGIITSKFSISLPEIAIFFKDSIPKDVYSTLLPFLQNANNSGNVIFFITIGFALASNGPHAIILASNALYKIKNKDYLTRRIKALFLTILLVTLFMFILLVLAFGNSILKFILSLSIFDMVEHNIYKIFILFKWPFAFIIIFVFVKVLYTVAPDQKISSRCVNRGAITTTIGWMFVTAIYSYYANNLANYDAIYGSLSSIAILMMWIYIISYILVMGIAINANEVDLLEENTSDKN